MDRDCGANVVSADTIYRVPTENRKLKTENKI